MTFWKGKPTDWFLKFQLFLKRIKKKKCCEKENLSIAIKKKLRMETLGNLEMEIL